MIQIIKLKENKYFIFHQMPIQINKTKLILINKNLIRFLRSFNRIIKAICQVVIIKKLKISKRRLKSRFHVLNKISKGKNRNKSTFQIKLHLN